MKTIRIKVPNKSYDKEWAVLDAVNHLLNKMETELGVEIYRGQGGNLDDWKEPDFGDPNGTLMLFRVSLKAKDKVKKVEEMIKRVERQYNDAKKRKSEVIAIFAQTNLKTAKELLASA